MWKIIFVSVSILVSSLSEGQFIKIPLQTKSDTLGPTKHYGIGGNLKEYDIYSGYDTTKSSYWVIKKYIFNNQQAWAQSFLEGTSKCVSSQ